MRGLFLVISVALIGLPPVRAEPVITANQLSKELVAMNLQLSLHTRFADSQYVLIDHAWLEKNFLPYFRGYLKHLGIPVQGGEGFDCDNYAQLFRAQITLSNLLAGGTKAGDVPCGVIIVQQRNAFAQVASSSRAYHSLIAIRTDHGWFVIEPQNGTIIALAHYPNLTGIIDCLI